MDARTRPAEAANRVPAIVGARRHAGPVVRLAGRTAVATMTVLAVLGSSVLAPGSGKVLAAAGTANRSANSGNLAEQRGGHPATTTQAAERRADLQEMRQRILQLQRDVAAGEASRAEAADQLRDAERAISDLQRELHELAAQRRERLAARDELQRQAHGIAGDLTAHQQRLAQTIIHRYQQGTPDSARLLLSGRDPNQIARDLVYLAAVADARQDVVRAASSSLDAKLRLADATRREAEALAAVEARQREQQLRLEGQRAQRQKLLAGLSSRLATQRQEIGALRRDEQRLARVVDRLNKLLAEEARARKKKAARRHAERPKTSGKPHDRGQREAAASANVGDPSGFGGRLSPPVAGTLTQRFGALQEGGGRWKGLFYRTAPGAEVRAAAAGQVVFADWLRGFGNLLIVDHGAGYLTIYGYNESLLRQVGDRVERGNPIASAGNSGGRGETGLYFELRHQGTAIDPGRWLR